MLKFLVQFIFVAAVFCCWQRTNSKQIGEDIQFQQNNEFYGKFRYKRSPPGAGSNEDANAKLSQPAVWSSVLFGITFLKNE